MKFRCNGIDLNDAVLKVSKAVAIKNINPILEGIKLSVEGDELTLCATDLELSIEKKIRADVIVSGEVVVPSKIFAELVKKLLNETIEFNLNEQNQLKITYGENEGFLQCFDANEYPQFKKIENAQSFEISQKNLKQLINKSIISAAIDDSRPILKGCLFEINENSVTAVALDGYRLGLINKEISDTSAMLNAVIPTRSLIEISKLLEDSDELVKIYIQKNYLMCQNNDATILTRLLDGDFINYKKIIPEKQSGLVTINKTQFEDAIERASLLSRNERNNIIKFEITDSLITITSNSEVGEICEKVACKSNITNLKIAFNAKYFLDVLKAQSDEFIQISFESVLEPCVIRPVEGNEFLYLILPVRMPN